MLSDTGYGKVYLACGATDLRKSIDGLAAIVSIGFALDPFSECSFAFCNRERDKLKILRWHHCGFWLYYRRLEQGRFEWPESGSTSTMVVSRRQLQWLLDGLPLEQRQAHPEVRARRVV